LLVLIDGTCGKITAVSITEHEEPDVDTDGLKALVDSLAGKSAYAYLERTKSEPELPVQVQAVTGATVTSDGVIDGVNDCIGVFMALDNPYYARESGVVTVWDADGTELGVFRREDLLELQGYRRKLVIHSGSEGDTTHDFRGVRFSEALALIDPTLLEQYSGVIVSGIDGYSAELSMEEIQMENNVFIMYEDNGAPISDFSGNTGALRVVILNDSFGQRFANVLSDIRLVQ
jgi:hypothetical protein